MGSIVDISTSATDQGDDMSDQICQVCGIQFKDGDALAAVMLTTFKKLESDVHFAVTHPTKCLEIFHITCYEGDDRPERGHIEVN